MNINPPTHDNLSADLLSRAKHGSVIIGLDEIDLAQLGITQSTPVYAAFAAHGFATTDPATVAATAHALATADIATSTATAHDPATADFATAEPAAHAPAETHHTPRTAVYPNPEPHEHAQVQPNGALLLSACGSAARCAEQLSAGIPPEAADCALLCRMPANVQVDELSCISGLARRIAGCRMSVVTDSALSECEVTLYIPSRQSAV